jgi:hypothetical protein
VHPNRLEVIDGLAAPDPRQHRVLLVVTLGRDDQGDVPTHRLGGRIAEHALRRAIPRQDRAGEILADDRVVGGFDDRGQAGRVESSFCADRPKGIGHPAIPGHAE